MITQASGTGLTRFRPVPCVDATVSSVHCCRSASRKRHEVLSEAGARSPARFDRRDVETRVIVDAIGRQTKETAAAAMNLPPPHHISTSHGKREDPYNSRVTGSWGCAVRRSFIAQAETAVIIPFRVQSRHLQLRLKIDLDGIVRCSPPGSGYSPRAR